MGNDMYTRISIDKTVSSIIVKNGYRDNSQIIFQRIVALANLSKEDAVMEEWKYFSVLLFKADITEIMYSLYEEYKYFELVAFIYTPIKKNVITFEFGLPIYELECIQNNPLRVYQDLFDEEESIVARMYTMDTKRVEAFLSNLAK